MQALCFVQPPVDQVLRNFLQFLQDKKKQILFLWHSGPRISDIKGRSRAMLQLIGSGLQLSPVSVLFYFLRGDDYDPKQSSYSPPRLGKQVAEGGSFFV